MTDRDHLEICNIQDDPPGSLILGPVQSIYFGRASFHVIALVA